MGKKADNVVQAIDIQQVLCVGLAKNPDAIALIDYRKRYTWYDLEKKSSALAKSLLAAGLVPGDRVASLMPNQGELVLLYLACIKSGVVVTPLNYRYRAQEIDHALSVSGAKMLIAHTERDDDLAATNLVRQLPLGVVRDTTKNDTQPSLEAMIENEFADITLPKREPAENLAIFFTSGSTGKPKGVTHTLETLGWMSAITSRAVGLREDDVMLKGSSFSHIGGFLWGLACLAKGAQIIIPHAFNSDEILPILRDFNPTILSMIPAALFEIVRDRHGTHSDFSSLRLCLAGGDKISSTLEHEFIEKAGIVVSEIYGMTEIGCSHFNHDRTLSHLGSLGTVADGIEARLVDDEGKQVSHNLPGRLLVKSNCITVGYWGNEAATLEAFSRGWFDTGDVMTVDENGFYWFCGRKKQIIVHDGSNICPQEIEESLQNHPAVEHAGVVGVHDRLHGENVIAYITVRSGSAIPEASDVINVAREQVGYKAPEEVVILDKMPFNAAGKIDRVTLKRLAREAHRIDPRAD